MPFAWKYAWALAMMGLWLVVAWQRRLYISRRTVHFRQELKEVVSVSLLVALLFIAAAWFFDVSTGLRNFVIVGIFHMIFWVSIGRWLSRLLLRRLRAKGYNLRHVVLLGTGNLALQVIDELENNDSLGLRIAGVVELDSHRPASGFLSAKVPILGHAVALQEIIATHGIQQVFVALPITQLHVLKGVMQELSKLTVDVRLIPDIAEYSTLAAGMEQIGSLSVINLQATPCDGWGRVGKRMLDFSFSLSALVLCLPLLIVLS
ncbi:MAG TPA: hypothetical protein EYO58_09970, partial [Flavobacteriales bacterium]|nr:hypothetical protein [Flavobacteriales bacterium]